MIACDELISFPVAKELELLALEAACCVWQDATSDRAKVVEVRFFGGLSLKEAACIPKAARFYTKSNGFCTTYIKALLSGSC
jgi:hypothetical protein